MRLSASICAGFLLGLGISACTITNPDHCTNNGADYCGAGEGCDSCRDHLKGCFPLGDIADGCLHDYPNTSTDTDTTGSTTGTASGSTSPTTSTGPTTTTTGPTTSSSSSGTSTTGTGSTTGGCSGDGECSGDTPYCVEMTCVGCQNAPAGYCGENTPATPACDAGSGTCVECTTAEAGACLGVTPVCDDDTNACVACTEHAQCADSACDLETGACMPDDKVWWVEGPDTAPCGTGTMADPFCQVTQALAMIGNGEKGTVNIKNFAGAYTQQIQLVPNTTVALVGEGGPVVDVLNFEAIQVGGTGYLAGLVIDGAGTNGVESESGAKTWIDDCTLSASGDKGVTATGSEVHLRRSVVFNNSGGGVTLTGSSEMWMENSVVGLNGNATAAAGVDQSNSTVHIIYSTIAGNNGQTFDTLNCDGGGGDIRNSILSGEAANSIDGVCAAITFSKNALDTAALMGADNTLIGMFDVGWFVAPGSGNFHLTGNNPFMDVGEWKTGDPAADIDGDARPTVDGTADYVGADVP